MEKHLIWGGFEDYILILFSIPLPLVSLIHITVLILIGICFVGFFVHKYFGELRENHSETHLTRAIIGETGIGIGND